MRNRRPAGADSPESSAWNRNNQSKKHLKAVPIYHRSSLILIDGIQLSFTLSTLAAFCSLDSNTLRELRLHQYKAPRSSSYRGHGWRRRSIRGICWHPGTLYHRPRWLRHELQRLGDAVKSVYEWEYVMITLTGWAARLGCQRIHEQMQKYNIAFAAIRIAPSIHWESVFLDECGVHIVKHIGPNFSSSWHRREVSVWCITF